MPGRPWSSQPQQTPGCRLAGPLRRCTWPSWVARTDPAPVGCWPALPHHSSWSGWVKRPANQRRRWD